MTKIIEIKTCNECQYCEHNGRLQAYNKIYLMCHKVRKSKAIGRMYADEDSCRDNVLTHQPPEWCPLEDYKNIKEINGKQIIKCDNAE